jgi:hypothetical protein
MLQRMRFQLPSVWDLRATTSSAWCVATRWAAQDAKAVRHGGAGMPHGRCDMALACRGVDDVWCCTPAGLAHQDEAVLGLLQLRGPGRLHTGEQEALL